VNKFSIIFLIAIFSIVVLNPLFVKNPTSDNFKIISLVLGEESSDDEKDSSSDDKSSDDKSSDDKSSDDKSSDDKRTLAVMTKQQMILPIKQQMILPIK
jgi:hypothetical protein